mgnify:CR=1 FL=1|tara:strand:- start:277 stop:879 length:603 start_codon:yes stop_codon:yes gene_type:complete
MKKVLLLLSIVALLSSCKQKEESVLRLHKGQYALCAASGALPTGNKIMVQGREFEEGCAVCPVLDGPSISNLAMYGDGGTWGEFNVKNNFKTPDNTDQTVWSLFWYVDSLPQAPTWKLQKGNNRELTVNTAVDSLSMSNMFCMPCKIWKVENGTTLAKCYGPLNEAAVPLRKAMKVRDGEISITQAKDGFPYPVGTVIPE